MRTIFVGGQEKPNGVNSYTYNLASELIDRGYNASVLSFGCEDKSLYYGKVPVYQFKTIGGTTTSIPHLYYKTIPFIIRHRKEVDITIYQTVPFSVIPALILRMFGIKTAAIVHSMAEDSPKHGKLYKKILSLYTKMSMTLTKHVITVSNTKAEDIWKRYGKQVQVLPCGVSVPKQNANMSNVLKINGIQKGRYFLTIGRIDPIKNLEDLIDAFLKHSPNGYQLVIGGDVNSPYGETVVNRAKGNHNIIFPGIVSGDDKAMLLKNCLAYCLVSSSEGLPIALLEGMSYGKIPIVSEISAIKEVLSNYSIGLWNKVHSVEEVADNMKLVEEHFTDVKFHGDKALSIVEENYTWNHICDLYLELMKQLYS